MRLELLRRAYFSHCTLGELIFGPISIYTLEPEWAGNERGTSCIPVGEYEWKRKLSPTKGRVLELLGVPGRDNIEVHVGNFRRDTEGCILVGHRFSLVDNRFALSDSHAAMGELLDCLGLAEGGSIYVHNIRAGGEQ